MIIRPILPRDIQELQELDISYSTDCVWQMEQRIRGEEVSTTFRPIRLPRPIKVEPERDNGWLEDWQSNDLSVVVEEDGDVWGYLDLTMDRGQNIGRINHLAVSHKKRRRGLGAALMQEAKRWSKVRRVRALVAETNTKNYPAIRFLQKAGFSFWGFNDSYYANKDIRVFFVCTLG